MPLDGNPAVYETADSIDIYAFAAKVADVLESRGHCSGSLFIGQRVCLMGATILACGVEPRDWDRATADHCRISDICDRLTTALGFARMNDAARWSDVAGGPAVIDTLRAVSGRGR